jgi:guanine deaminase
MAHCVHSYAQEGEAQILRESGAHVAHCPQSNTNLSSGIAPVRKFLRDGVRVGLGSDVAGGSDTSILRVMRHAIEVSKLYRLLADRDDKALSIEEAFWLGTAGGGSFFGNVGTFAPGAEFDAVVFDDSTLEAPYPLTITERVARIVHYADDRSVAAKYARGARVTPAPAQLPCGTCCGPAPR